MNLSGRQPIQRPHRVPRDSAYMARVAGLPCVICEAYGEPQASPTQVHHTIMDRGGNARTPDRECIPLCEGHHVGMFDTSKIAIHRAPNAWRNAYGTDRDYIAITLDRLGV